MLKFNFEQYRNNTYGCITVIAYSHYDEKRKLNFVKVRCNRCGNVFLISTNRLKRKHSYCLKCPNKKEKITHNKRIRRVYANMKDRCSNPKNNRYYCYGARGIRVCEEWKNSYASFERWSLANGYRDDLTIDRIDNNGNYCPENCRWTTYREQRINSNSSRKIAIDGVTKSITEWCEYYKIPYYIINNRINKYGWEPKKAFENPIKRFY